jgi:hypothetical protein
VLQYRLVGHRDELFGHCIRKWPEAGPRPACQYQGFHSSVLPPRHARTSQYLTWAVGPASAAEPATRMPSSAGLPRLRVKRWFDIA